MKRRWRYAAGTLLVALPALTACSQTAALAPVGGNRLAEIRFAVNDILIARQVPILTAPVCTATDVTTISCTGSTIDHQTISALSSSRDQAKLTVRVGTSTIFDGPFMAVLNANAQPSS